MNVLVALSAVAFSIRSVHVRLMRVARGTVEMSEGDGTVGSQRVWHRAKRRSLLQAQQSARVGRIGCRLHKFRVEMRSTRGFPRRGVHASDLRVSSRVLRPGFHPPQAGSKGEAATGGGGRGEGLEKTPSRTCLGARRSMLP